MRNRNLDGLLKVIDCQFMSTIRFSDDVDDGTKRRGYEHQAVLSNVAHTRLLRYIIYSAILFQQHIN